MLIDKFNRYLSDEESKTLIKMFDKDKLNEINNDWTTIRKNLNTNNKISVDYLFNYINNYYKYKGTSFGLTGGSKGINVPKTNISNNNIMVDKPVPMDIDRPRRVKKARARVGRGRATGGRTGGKKGGGIHQIVKVFLQGTQDKQPVIQRSYNVDTRSVAEQNKTKPTKQETLPNQQQQQQPVSINVNPVFSPTLHNTPSVSSVVKPFITSRPVITNRPTSTIKPIIKPVIKPTLNSDIKNNPTISIITKNNPNQSVMPEINNNPVNTSTFYPQPVEPVNMEGVVEEQQPEPVVQPPEPVVQPPEPVVQPPEPVVQSPEPVLTPAPIIPEQSPLIPPNLFDENLMEIELKSRKRPREEITTPSTGGEEIPIKELQPKQNIKVKVVPKKEKINSGISMQSLTEKVVPQVRSFIEESIKLERDIPEPSSEEVRDFVIQNVLSKSFKKQRKIEKLSKYNKHLIGNAFIEQYKKKVRSSNLKSEN